MLELTEKQILALKAVTYGCNTNSRLRGASYMIGRATNHPQEISFYEALSIVDQLIADIEGGEG